MCTICQIHLNVLPNLTLPSNPLEKATLPPIIRMVGARLRDIKSITEIMQVADRAEVQSPSVWPEVDRLPTSCSCLVHVDSSTRNCGSGRDCGDSHSVFSSIDGKTPWHTGFFFFFYSTFQPSLPLSQRCREEKQKGSSSPDVQKCLVLSPDLCQLLVRNVNATKNRAMF